MKNSIFLVCIVILAIFLRFNNLNSVPPSPSLDEVSIGYNAYSILKTGADEYGTKLPILLRAYDDWRPALYVYSVIPFIHLFGLNILAVRLPSVILSILTIIATYFLTKELFNSSRSKLEIGNWKLEIPEVTSLLLAISPWHIYISRLGHEVNAGLSFVIFAILFFLKAINNRKGLLLFLSLVFFVLALYTYQSEKVFAPLILFLLIIIYRDKLFKIEKKTLTFALFLGLMLITPITLATLSPEGLVRFKGTSAFREKSFYKKSADNVLKFKNEGNIFEEIVNNRRLVPLKIFATNYFSHFNPKFIFSNNGDESFKAPNFGLMYIWELPFLIIGIIFLLKQTNLKIKLVLGCWLLISFIAPSLTTGAPHAMRAFNVLPVPQVFTALGIMGIVNFIKESKINSYFIKFLYLSMLVIVVYFLTNFYKEYFYSFPQNQSSSFQYSLHSVIKFVLKNESYNKIIFSNKDNLYQSYMFYLFDSKYDPYLYQKQGGTKSGGFEETHAFARYEFRPIVWEKDKFLKDTLFVGNVSDFSNEVEGLIFKNLDSKAVIKVVKR